MLFGRRKVTCAARHRLSIRHKLGTDAASGRSYRVVNRLLSSTLTKRFGWRRENDQVSRRAFGLRTSPLWFGPDNGLSARAVVGRRGPSAGSGVCEHSNCENPVAETFDPHSHPTPQTGFWAKKRLKETP